MGTAFQTSPLVPAPAPRHAGRLPSRLAPRRSTTARRTPRRHRAYSRPSWWTDADPANETLLSAIDNGSITYQYDAIDHQTLKHFAANTTNDVAYAYDLLGRRLSALYPNQANVGVAWAWDKAGRRMSETSYGLAVSFAYDGAGNRSSSIWPDGQGIFYTFDAANYFEWVGIAGGAVGVGFGYDNLGRLAWNGRGTTQSNIGFDSADRVTSVAHALTSGAVTYGFGYSPASQVVTATTTNTAYDWTAPSSQTVNTVADGLNRDAATAAVGAPCAASLAGYDCNGNLTRTPDGLYTYAYDGENRLTGKTIVATNASVITLAYDPLGRLWQTTAGGVVTQYLYDNDALVAQYDGAGNLLRRYVHGPGVDNPVIWFEGTALTSASTSLLIADRQGSIIATTNTAGAVTNTYTYDPYGNPSSWSVPGFGYTGQLALPLAQLWHYKARSYDPASGRFLQTDPIGQGDDPNLYAYVKDDPTNKADPTGLVAGVDDATIAILATATVATVIVVDAVNNQCGASCVSTAVDQVKDFVGGLISQSRGGGNRLPPTGPPDSTQTNKPGTQQIKYGPDGRPVQEWNKGHPGYKPPEDQDHVHDHLPRPPQAPPGAPIRQPGRPPGPGDLTGPAKPPPPPPKPPTPNP